MSEAFGNQGLVFLNEDAWNALSKSSNEPRKKRVDFPREDYSTAPWQVMLDTGAYKDTTTKAEFAAVYDGSKVDEQTARKFFYRFNCLFVGSICRAASALRQSACSPSFPSLHMVRKRRLYLKLMRSRVSRAPLPV